MENSRLSQADSLLLKKEKIKEEMPTLFTKDILKIDTFADSL